MKGIKTDPLYRLVESLSIKERSQFVKHLKQNKAKTDSKKLLLFRLVVRNVKREIKNYLEEGKKRTSASNLTTIKHLLYKSLLSYLALSCEETNRARVSQMVDQINILISRGLINEALKLNRKAQKKAKENHLHYLYIELSFSYRRLIRQYATKNISQQLMESQDENNKVIESIKEDIRYFDIFEKLFIQKRLNQDDATNNSIKELNKLNLEKPKSFEGEIYYYFIQRLKFNHFKAFDKELEYSRLIASSFENNPALLRDYLPRYLRIINNLINSCFRTGNVLEAKEHIDRIKKMSARNFYQESQLKSLIISSEIIYFFFTQQISSICNKSDFYLEQIKTYQTFIPYERYLEINYNIAVAFFYKNQIEKSQEWLNQCLSQQENIEFKEQNINPQIGRKIEARAIVLRLIVFYELGNLKLLRNFIGSAIHFFKFKKDDSLISFTKIIDFVQKLLKEDINLEKSTQNLAIELEKEIMMDEFIFWLNKWH